MEVTAHKAGGTEGVMSNGVSLEHCYAIGKVFRIQTLCFWVTGFVCLDLLSEQRCQRLQLYNRGFVNGPIATCIAETHPRH